MTFRRVLDADISARADGKTPVWDATSGTHLYESVALPAAPSRVLIYRNTDQSIPHNAATAISFSHERADPDGYWTSGDPTKVTIPTGKGGLFLIVGHLAFASTNQDSSEMGLIRLNGTTYIARQSAGETEKGATGGVVNVTVPTIYPLAAADYLELMAYHINTGSAARNISSLADYSPEFRLVRLGD